MRDNVLTHIILMDALGREYHRFRLGLLGDSLWRANPPEVDILPCGIVKLTPQCPRLLPHYFQRVHLNIGKKNPLQCA